MSSKRRTISRRASGALSTARRRTDRSGPYKLLPEPIIKNERVEGPALALVGGRALLYVDYYVNHRYGARETSDWKSWRDVSAETRVVSGQRHGSILPITRAELRMLAPNMDRPAPPPVLPGVNADPNIAVFGDTFYLYPTTDGYEGWGSTSFHAWSSRDLAKWKDEGVILDLPRDLTWAKRYAWAPTIATKNGKYYFYYSAQQNIGVAVADKPDRAVQRSARQAARGEDRFPADAGD